MSTAQRPTTAMVLAAGLGTRMRPLTDTLPKPLVPLAGRAMIDHVLDRLAAAGITTAVVNVHYLADAIEQHLKARKAPRIVISDERGVLLETGGGVLRALPLLGNAPFVIHNSDSVWIERGVSNLDRLLDAWDETRMDSLMLLAPTAASLGYDGRGDFNLNSAGVISRRAASETAPYVFAGVSIIHPKLFAGESEGPFSLNRVWDRAISAGRLYGITLEGLWMHVGTPDALDEANAAMAAAQGQSA
ncbi:MAG: nucleotidyltransferase family protein [Hyphomicrobium sp.]|jgi:MurNAc alpha-1-phosphate uridylyltransferase|nr:nucleotidyltransferase family protein [Hyphomicrobium sp.]